MKIIGLFRAAVGRLTRPAPCIEYRGNTYTHAKVPRKEALAAYAKSGSESFLHFKFERLEQTWYGRWIRTGDVIRLSLLDDWKVFGTRRVA
ncbi:MAG: hypothetical protein P1V51_19775 [Deltaproteobacteria bacterium]|nr:hypothetical protein [Deltaproteobacteria bacterium]